MSGTTRTRRAVGTGGFLPRRAVYGESCLRRIVCASAWAIAVAIGSTGWADEEQTAEDIKAAAEEFDQGRRAFKAKDFVEAAEHFESADSHAPSATALELALRSRDKAGQLERAATLAALAQQRHPEADFTKKLVPPILKRASEELHELTAQCDTPCELVVETKLVHGRRATERIVFLQPGKYTVRAGWSGGRTVPQDVEATKAGKSELSFKEPPEEKAETPLAGPAPTSAPEDDEQPDDGPVDRGVDKPEGWSPIVFFVGAGLTAVAGGITIWSGIDTQNNPGVDRVKSECAGQGESCPTYQEGLDNQRRTNILIGVTAGLGVATGLIGIFATDWSGSGVAGSTSARRRVAKAENYRVEPWIGLAEGVTLGGARGRF
jgi:hypothetical protein